MWSCYKTKEEKDVLTDDWKPDQKVNEEELTEKKVKNLLEN